MTAAARWQQRGSCGGGGSATARGRRQLGGGADFCWRQRRDVAWRRCGGGGSVSGSGGSATARRWRQLGGGASNGDGNKEGDGEYNNQI